LVVNANHLEVFIMQIGATLVFKILSKFAFKNIPKMVKTPSYLAFTFQFKIYEEFLVGP
jgi:hypothetical protein